MRVRVLHPEPCRCSSTRIEHRSCTAKVGSSNLPTGSKCNIQRYTDVATAERRLVASMNWPESRSVQQIVLVMPEMGADR